MSLKRLSILLFLQLECFLALDRWDLLIIHSKVSWLRSPISQWKLRWRKQAGLCKKETLNFTEKTVTFSLPGFEQFANVFHFGSEFVLGNPEKACKIHGSACARTFLDRACFVPVKPFKG